MHEESTQLAGEHKCGRVTLNVYLEGTAVLCKKLEISIFFVFTSSVLGAVFLLCLSCDVILSTKV